MWLQSPAAGRAHVGSAAWQVAFGSGGQGGQMFEQNHFTLRAADEDGDDAFSFSPNDAGQDFDDNEEEELETFVALIDTPALEAPAVAAPAPARRTARKASAKKKPAAKKAAKPAAKKAVKKAA